MIADAIRQAQQMHRAVIEQTYAGVCTVYEKRSAIDPDTKVTHQREAVVLSEIPCRLSFSGKTAAGQAAPATPVSQTIKLFLSPEYDIRSGSKIVVTQDGCTESYCRSGKPAVYATHQEVVLELWKGYA